MHWIQKWQFLGLLPLWLTGEMIALMNAFSRFFWGVRLFDLL